MRVKVSKAGAAAGVAGTGLMVTVVFAVMVVLALAAIAAIAVWLVPIATAGAIAVGFWQAYSGLILLYLIRAILFR